MTQTSFEASLVMNNLPSASKITSTGRKQLRGQTELSGLLMTLIAASVEVEGSVGWPVAGSISTLLRRYPSGGLLFLVDVSKLVSPGGAQGETARGKGDYLKSNGRLHFNQRE